MGNSCGDVADYWKIIYNNKQCMGAFVWEWADHAIKTKKGYLYGGDFGESEHDGNFCCDGLVTPDRKLKSGAYEVKAVYGGKLESVAKDVELPIIDSTAKGIKINVDERTGALNSLIVDGIEILKTPLKINFIRYTDNDRRLDSLWNEKYNLLGCNQYVTSCEKLENGYRFSGYIASNCHSPIVDFIISYLIEEGIFNIDFEYIIADFVQSLPRIGFEFGIDKKLCNFSYVGYGPFESYVDKHVASEYGYYSSDAYSNYEMGYIKPQESGSHYNTTYVNVADMIFVLAETPFSFSINPYTTKQLISSKHNFELKDNGLINVCLDLFMRGVGSHSCGPYLSKEYEIPKQGKNKFKLFFNKPKK